MGGPGGENERGDTGFGIAVDGAGNIFVSGAFSTTADFDPSPAGVANLTSAGGQDIFFLKT
jgi:hypothetical protein